MKQYYFLCGLPRCGNTLFASILNQNKDITVTANSIVPTILNSIRPIYDTKAFLAFPDYQSLDNVVKNVFNNYYENFDSNIIIDRGPWGTPANLDFLKAMNMNSKFIVLKRPIVEILASFIKIEKCKNVEQRCEVLMSDEGMVSKYYWSYKNLLKSENTLVIEYSELCNNPELIIDNVYDFLNLSKYAHSYNNLNQLEINDIKYDDSVWLGEYHTIRSNVNRDQYNIEDYLPQSVISKYEQA